MVAAAGWGRVGIPFWFMPTLALSNQIQDAQLNLNFGETMTISSISLPKIGMGHNTRISYFSEIQI